MLHFMVVMRLLNKFKIFLSANFFLFPRYEVSSTVLEFVRFTAVSQHFACFLAVPGRGISIRDAMKRRQVTR